METPLGGEIQTSARFEVLFLEHCIRRLQGWIAYIGVTALLFAVVGIYFRSELLGGVHHAFLRERYFEYIRKAAYGVVLGLAAGSMYLRQRLNDETWLRSKVLFRQKNLSDALKDALEKDLPKSEHGLFVLLMTTFKLESMTWAASAWIALVASFPFMVGGPAHEFLIYLAISATLLIFHRPTVDELEDKLAKFAKIIQEGKTS